MTFPTVQFIQFNKDINPSGFRHIPASGIKLLDTSITGFLDFGNANTTTSGVISQTKMAIFRAASLGTASGIYNLKFFLNSATAFSVGSYRFLWRPSIHWQGAGFQLGLSDLDIPVTEPTSQNILTTTGGPSISGIVDQHVSQYIYLAVFVNTDVPFGTYGGGGIGSFRYRMVYDFS